MRYDSFAPVDESAVGMWRYRHRLPVGDADDIVSLGEGGTPLVALGARAVRASGAAAVAMKCEHLGPTGSFKDRIASVAVTLARARGLRGLAGTSSGNGGAAAAAYSARAGLPLTIFALADIPAEKLAQLRAFGATAYLVAGIGFDAASTKAAASTISSYAAAADVFPFLTGGRFSPEAMEGAKTIAYEIVEQQPDATVIYAPVGGGGLLSALGRGLAELGDAGVTVPRLVAVQPAGCATLAPALEGDFRGVSGTVTSRISGLQVAVLFDGVGAVEAITSSGGHLVEVSDDEVDLAQVLLATDSGLLVEPAGATAFAGLLADAAAGRVAPTDRVVVLGTGAGYKDGGALARMSLGAPLTPISIAELEAKLR